MARIELAPEVFDDFDRIVDHLVAQGVDDAPARIQDIIGALAVLEHSPMIGRPIGNDARELVIGRRARGFVALYRYLPEAEFVFVLGVRGQREAGYSRF